MNAMGIENNGRSDLRPGCSMAIKLRTGLSRPTFRGEGGENSIFLLRKGKEKRKEKERR
jgi:hypothetical protein